MNLSAYLKRERLSYAAFAKRVGVSSGLVWQWLNGYTAVSALKAKAIEEATDGAVKRHELRPDIFDKAA